MSKPVVLAHGAFTGSWEWEAVVDDLRARGIAATVVDLTTLAPRGSLRADEESVRAAVAAAGPGVVLVGHSYSGAVITGASAGNPGVDHLVYVAATVPDEGESVAAARGGQPTGAPAGELEPVNREVTAARLFNDATPEQLAAVIPRLAGFVRSAFDEIPSGLGWREHPSTYVECTDDLAFSSELQDRFASRTTERVTLQAGHSPMVTRPAEVAEIIAEIATRT